MNKLKLMYDVVKTMKEKEIIQGTLKMDSTKDHTSIFSLTNEFARNLQSGETKVKLSTQLGHDGKQVKHESYTEFNIEAGHGHMLHSCRGHQHHPGHGHFGPVHGMNHGGFKDKLTRLTFLLNILNQIKIAEQEDKSCILTFSLNEFPEEMRRMLNEKMDGRHDQHHRMMEEFLALESANLEAIVRINSNNEVEQVLFTLEGQGAGSEETKAMSLKAELNLTW